MKLVAGRFITITKTEGTAKPNNGKKSIIDPKRWRMIHSKHYLNLFTDSVLLSVANEEKTNNHSFLKIRKVIRFHCNCNLKSDQPVLGVPFIISLLSSYMNSIEHMESFYVFYNQAHVCRYDEYSNSVNEVTHMALKYRLGGENPSLSLLKSTIAV